MTQDNFLLDRIGTKRFFTKGQLANFLRENGLSCSYHAARYQIKDLPWIRISPRRSVIDRETLLNYLEKHTKKT